MTRWVFFDVGNVLFDDQAQSCAAYRLAFAALRECEPELTVAELFAERERLANSGAPWILAALLEARFGAARAKQFLAEFSRSLAAEYDRWHLSVPRLGDTLDDLARDFRLGIVANQPVECRAALRRRGLEPRFAVVGISDAEGLHKPDPEFFRWALLQAGAEPAACAMVGDRLDNDIAPARELGFRTVHLDWAAGARPWRPEDDFARAFAASCRREPTFGRRREEVRPDAIVPDLPSVPVAVRKLFADKPQNP